MKIESAGSIHAQRGRKMRMLGYRKLVALLVVAFAMSAPTLAAGALNTISYQGQLSDEGALVDGTVSFKFAIVDVDGTETTLWSNDSSSTEGSEPTTFLDLVVEGGVFQVQLGAAPMDPLPEGFLLGASDPILRVWIKGIDDPGFQALGDQDLGASPFAFRAAVSDTSLTGGATGGSSVWETNGADAYRLTGNVGIGTASPEETIHVVGNAKIDGSLNVSDDGGFPIRFTRPGLDPWKITQTFAGSGGLAFFKDPGDVGSLWGLYLAQNGSVGVGTETPSARLDVAGDTRTTQLHIGAGTAAGHLSINAGTGTGQMLTLDRDNFDRWGLYVTSSGHAGLGFYNITDARYSIFMDQEGNVGLGANNLTPDATLDVAGDAKVIGLDALSINLTENGPSHTSVVDFPFASINAGPNLLTMAYETDTGAPLSTITMASSFTRFSGSGRYEFNQGSQTFRIMSNGYVGVLTTPTYPLDVDGTIRCQTLIETSDSRLKKDVEPLQGALGTVRHLKPVSFRWREADEEPDRGDRTHLGFLAQDVNRVLPDLVYGDDETSLAVSYLEFIPLLVESVQELESIVGNQSRELLQRDQKIEELESRLQRLEARMSK